MSLACRTYEIPCLSPAAQDKHNASPATMQKERLHSLEMNLLQGKTVLILGLGLHGGGLSSLQFAAAQGAQKILVSDLAPKTKFAQQFREQASSVPVEYEFGMHSEYFLNAADLIIKNPAIPPNAVVLKKAQALNKHIETDISLYLRHNHHSEHKSKLLGVTGTKGKSSISSALHTLLENNSPLEQQTENSVRMRPYSTLAGNIRTSPLTLISTQTPLPRYTVCELSAQQIGDLRLTDALPVQEIQCLVFSNFMRDHLNFYPDMETYFEAKSYIFSICTDQCFFVLPNTPWGKRLSNFTAPEHCIWHSDTALGAEHCGAWIENTKLHYRNRVGDAVQTLEGVSAHTTSYRIQNILTVMAAGIALQQELPQHEEEWEALFHLSHRKELVGYYSDRCFINDSAATIPQAMQLHALQPKLKGKLHLICGGSDKQLLAEDMLSECAHAVHSYLLEGSYTEQFLPLLAAANHAHSGPYSSMEQALMAAHANSSPGDTIILSPGCASFGMFQHEFDRGDQFKSLVHSLFKKTSNGTSTSC